jgi:hypothetical protein
MYFIYNQNLELLTTVQAQKLDNYAGAIQLISGGEVIVSIPHSLIVSSVLLPKGESKGRVLNGTYYPTKPTPVDEVKSPEEVKALNILKEKANEGSYAPISELADKGYQGEVKAEPYIYHNLQLVDREKGIVKDFVADALGGAQYSTYYYRHGELIYMARPGDDIDTISTHIKFSQPTTVNLKGHMSLYIVDLIEVTEDMVVLYFDAKKVTAVKRKDFELLEPKINFKF